MVRHTANMNNINLKVDLAGDLPRARGDSRGLQQVLFNLVNNAIYALNGSGTITITTRFGKSDDYLAICVQDDGCGILPEFMDKIFDPFFTTKKVGEGYRPGAFCELWHYCQVRRHHRL